MNCTAGRCVQSRHEDPCGIPGMVVLAVIIVLGRQRLADPLGSLARQTSLIDQPLGPIERSC